MPTGLQANNLSPMGFGQPNMRRFAAQQPGPGYGMPGMPVPPGQQAQPAPPPGGAGRAGPPGAMPPGIPGGLYQSPMGQQAVKAKPKQFPADATYNRIQSAILNPGPPRPMMSPPPQVPAPGGPPIGPGEVNLGGGPTPIGRPVMSPGLLGPAPTALNPPPTGMGMPAPGNPDFAAAMQFMQQQLGGGQF